jgi:hypothetical protein
MTSCFVFARLRRHLELVEVAFSSFSRAKYWIRVRLSPFDRASKSIKRGLSPAVDLNTHDRISSIITSSL